MLLLAPLAPALCASPLRLLGCRRFDSFALAAAHSSPCLPLELLASCRLRTLQSSGSSLRCRPLLLGWPPSFLLSSELLVAAVALALRCSFSSLSCGACRSPGTCHQTRGLLPSASQMV